MKKAALMKVGKGLWVADWMLCLGRLLTVHSGSLKHFSELLFWVDPGPLANADIDADIG
jgi:hypothetical protein